LFSAVPGLLIAYLAVFFGEAFAYKRHLVPLWFIRFKAVLTGFILLSLGVTYVIITPQ
jgi:hypothetical protein